MAQGPSDTILVAIRITLRIRESKVRNPDHPDRRTFVLCECILVVHWFRKVDNNLLVHLLVIVCNLYQDNANQSVEIGVSSIGLLLYQDRLRVNRFMWPKIIKFSYKWNTFTVKVRPGEVFLSRCAVVLFAVHVSAKWP